MPELPEVECFRRHLETHILGKIIIQIRILATQLLENINENDFIENTVHQQIDKTFRHGKFLYLHLNPNNLWMVIHFGMTGYFRYTTSDSNLQVHDRILYYYQNSKDQPDPQSIAIFNDQRKFGLISITKKPQEFIKQRGFGPDALQISIENFETIMHQNARKLKVVLMDQQQIAGIGNLYSDEMCFQAQIHPFRPARSLSSSEIHRLFEYMQIVLKRAIENDADIDRFPPEFFINLREKGKNCSRCEHVVQSSKVGGRMAYFCPHCQKI